MNITGDMFVRPESNDGTNFGHIIDGDGSVFRKIGENNRNVYHNYLMFTVKSNIPSIQMNFDASRKWTGETM